MGIESSSRQGHEGELEMYFDREVARNFAIAEQNEKNFAVARIVDAALLRESAGMEWPLRCAELGGGAHPDRYDGLFERLGTSQGSMDWVDSSAPMLELAQEYVSGDGYEKRRGIIRYVESDILEYLESLEDESLNIAIMKYTIDHIQGLERLFSLLSRKLKPGGKLVSTFKSDPTLRRSSTNAIFRHNDEDIPEGETRQLVDGDKIGVKFLRESGNPHGGLLEGAQTIKYFHSAERTRRLAEKYGFEASIETHEDPDGTGGRQELLILTKKQRPAPGE